MLLSSQIIVWVINQISHNPRQLDLVTHVIHDNEFTKWLDFSLPSPQQNVSLYLRKRTLLSFFDLSRNHKGEENKRRPKTRISSQVMATELVTKPTEKMELEHRPPSVRWQRGLGAAWGEKAAGFHGTGGLSWHFWFSSNLFLLKKKSICWFWAFSDNTILSP